MTPSSSPAPGAGANAAPRQTRDQERAAAAWAATPESPSDEYRSLVRGAGASIMTMGLGQTIAFYRAKAEPHHNRLAGALEAWVLNDTAPHDDVQSDDTQPGTAKSDQPPGKALLDAIMESSSAQYRQWTNEVLAYLTWLKRFAEAEATS